MVFYSMSLHKKGRGSCVLVNGECIKEWISESYRLSLFGKKFFIHGLFVRGLVSDSDISLGKTDESEFFFELKSSGINLKQMKTGILDMIKLMKSIEPTF